MAKRCPGLAPRTLFYPQDDDGILQQYTTVVLIEQCETLCHLFRLWGVVVNSLSRALLNSKAKPEHGFCMRCLRVGASSFPTDIRVHASTYTIFIFRLSEARNRVLFLVQERHIMIPYRRRHIPGNKRRGEIQRL